MDYPSYNQELQAHQTMIRSLEDDIEKLQIENERLENELAFTKMLNEQKDETLRMAREGLELAIKVGNNVAEYAGVKPNGELFAVSKRAITAIDKALEGTPIKKCANCKLNGMHDCPICYIENKTLVFVNHNPEWYCADFQEVHHE